MIEALSQYWYMELKDIILERHLRPIVRALWCLQSERHLEDIRTDKVLKSLASSFANVSIVESFNDDELEAELAVVLSTSYVVQDALFKAAQLYSKTEPLKELKDEKCNDFIE